MSKIMTVDLLSSIKGAKESEAINKLFEVIKKSTLNNENSFKKLNNTVSIDELREDEVIHSSAEEKRIIIENFPREKNGYLVVSKVIED